jgi:hypothetical protein
VLRDRRRSVAKRVRRSSAALARGGRTRETVDRLPAEIARRAKQTMREARRLVVNARRALRTGANGGGALVDRLEREIAPLLEGAVAKARRAGMQIRTVLADRAFATPAAQAALERQRVHDTVIPRRQRAAAIEHTHAWRRRYRFRNGIEGRISQLKRRGRRHTRLGGRSAPTSARHGTRPPSRSSAHTQIPLQRGRSPHEIAGAALYLASDGLELHHGRGDRHRRWHDVDTLTMPYETPRAPA